MPLPKPIKKEDKDEFIRRCMSDDIMNKEFKNGKQRFAICLNQFKNIKKTKGSASWDNIRKGDILGLS